MSVRAAFAFLFF